MGYQPSICYTCAAYYVCKKKYRQGNECKHYSPIPPPPPAKTISSIQKPEVQGKAVNNIDGIIMLLDLAAQLNANATIQKEDIPILLEALEPVIKKRTEYWKQLQERFKPFNIK